MASKVMVKIPVASFGQVNKSNAVNGELLVRTSDLGARAQEGASPKNDSARVAQLEQNIRFLQEQHTYMLSGLHKEIDSLRHRNRELQCQLVFIKGGIPSSPSSPEEDAKPKIYPSPKQMNITPLQVEILEKELGELKLQMHDLESNNAYLCQIIDEQKKNLDQYEQQREIAEQQPAQPDAALLRQIDEAETLIRHLRRENSDLRRENASLAVPFYQNGSGGNNGREGEGYRGGRGRYRGGGGGGGSAGNYRNSWFPPLPNAQTYWQQSNRGVEGGGVGAVVNGGGGGNTTLPSLNGHHGRRGSHHHHHNNNHYHGEGKKHRNSGQNRGQKQ